jgi:hypothetical protein
VAVEANGFVALSHSIDLAAGRHDAISVSLERATERVPEQVAERAVERVASPIGTLVIRSNLPADLYVNGERIAGGIESRSLSLAPGRYSIRLVHGDAGAKKWSDVEIFAGKTRELDHEFVVAGFGDVEVAASFWANVFLDGVDTGLTTPCVLKSIPVGDHSVELRREGFEITEPRRAIVVRAGTTVELDFAGPISPK